MKPGAKIALWGSILLVLCLGGLLLTAKLLMTPERVRQAVLPVVEKIFDRQVEIGTVNIDLFSGISLDHLVLSGQAGKPLLQADKVLLRYRFWPFLSGRLLVDQVRLQNPVLRVRRDESGAWNFAELLDHGESGTGPGTPTANPPEVNSSTADDPGLPFDLLVRHVELSGGQLEVTDQKLNPDAPYRFAIQDISLKVGNLSLEKPFAVNASMQIGGGRVDISGLIDPQRKKHDLELSLAELDLAPLSPYFKDLLPGIFSRARLQGDLKFFGRKEAFSLSGNMSLKEVFFELDALPKKPIRNAILRVAPDLKFNAAEGLVTLGPTRIDVNDIRATVQGTLDHLSGDPRVEVRLSWTDLELRDIFSSLPEGLLPQLEQLDVAGNLSGTLGLRGRLADPAALLQAGNLELDGVQFNLGRLRPALSGTFELVGHGVASRGLQVRFGDEIATLQLAVKDVLQRPLEVQSRVSAKSFNFDKILSLPIGANVQEEPAVDAESGPPPASGNGGLFSSPFDAEEESEPLSLPLVADGSMTIKSGVLYGLDFANLQLAYHFADNIIQVRRMGGDLAGGRFSKTATIDLGQKGYAYQGELTLQDVVAAPLLRALQPGMEGSLTGLLSLQASYSGAGVTQASLQRNLTGEGTFLLKDGELSGTKLSRGIVALLGLDQLRQMAIRKAEGRFKFSSGVAHIKGVLAGKDFRMMPEGQLEMAGPLDLSLPTRLAPSVAERLKLNSGLGRLVTDGQGWTLVPLKVEGTFNDPKVGLDSRQLGAAAEKKIKQKLQEKLEEKLGLKPMAQEGKIPAEKVLKDTLRGLLGQ